MLPFIPHLSNELLDLFKCSSKNEWPTIKKNLEQEVKFAVQINGKTRDILTLENNLSQKQIELKVQENDKLKKFFEDKKIIKTIFVKNNIINFLIK